MLAQCERQVRQGRSDILGPIRSRSSDRPCALTARKGHQFVYIGSSHCSMIWSICSPLFTIFIWCFNQFGGRIVLSYLFGHSQNIARVIKGPSVGMIKFNICLGKSFWYYLESDAIIFLKNVVDVNIFACWKWYEIKCIGDAGSTTYIAMFWCALVCFGLPWSALVCFGLPWSALVYISLPWSAVSDHHRMVLKAPT